MNLSQVDTESSSVRDESTVCAANTPPETVAGDLLDDNDLFDSAKPSASLVPWPGSTFIIRSVSSGEVMTLLDGQVVLTRPSTRGSFYWVCVETNGWLGFRNTVSGRFLGHNQQGKLCCLAERHQGWEYFCARVKPEGGCVLLMSHWESLLPVGFEIEAGVQKLARVGNRATSGIDWEFAKI